VVDAYVPPSKQTAEIALRAEQRRREKEQQLQQVEEVPAVDPLPVYYVQTSKEVKAVAERVSSHLLEAFLLDFIVFISNDLCVVTPGDRTAQIGEGKGAATAAH
jgi:hypothetical protein